MGGCFEDGNLVLHTTINNRQYPWDN
ncbi:uncharacterized protein G2W53_026042 [Senna tora]|uniref:Uncharacterized protein n=1 Tax=Senna tora TaxID=362788 RepID=A0A834TEA7_9FABA|nr:uncharacterized protein G2W53_026042 [Senna tora]